MNPILRNILAILAGLIIGSVVNMGIVMISGSIIPLPEGVDPSNMESINANIHLYGPQHFIPPFLAHALGTLIGALAAAKLAATHKMKFALGVGVFFLLGGIYASTLINSPMWFKVLDILAAYIPMGWLGGKWATKGGA